MTEETKKKLLYGGGAVASIVALVLFMKNRSGASAMPISRASGISGSGGPSAGTSANNSAALNAAVALAVEQSRQNSALQVAQLQANTALTVAGLQASTAQQAASEKTKQAAFGPGGAGTAAAPVAAKGLFDTLQELIDKAFGRETVEVGKTDATGNFVAGINPSTGQAVYGGELYPYAGPKEIYGPVPNETSGYTGAEVYDEFKDVLGGSSTTIADYYQGSTGGGDSLYFGDSEFNYGDFGSGDGEVYA